MEKILPGKSYQLLNQLNLNTMGLDMYLTKRTYIGAEFEHRKITGRVEIYKDGKPIKIDFNSIRFIEEYIVDWRKANHIHNWFVHNVQGGDDDCKDHRVSRDQLKELLDLCIRVKNESVLIEGEIHTGTIYKDGKETRITEEGKVIANSQVPEQLLPTTEGFFFGNTDYDEYYMDAIDDTIEVLKPLLEEPEDIDVSYYYQSSW